VPRVTVSVCTFGNAGDKRLTDLVLGLRRSSRPPRELIVAALQDNRFDLPPTGFPIRQVVLGSSVTSTARARNAAAAQARGDLLVFLDSHCIPDLRMVEDYAANAKLGGMLMGEVGYLPKDACKDGIQFESLADAAVWPDREPAPPALTAVPSSEVDAFTPLNFAIAARDFATIGGFDERFAGPGGEEIDFARAVASGGLPLWRVQGARAYQQFRQAHVPPVDQLDTVLRNARMLERKWGEPALQDWLRAFALMGLIDRTGTGWRKLREPGARHLALSEKREDQPFVDIASVLKTLEERAAAPREGKSGTNGPLRAA
jgi:hypothetical protein